MLKTATVATSLTLASIFPANAQLYSWMQSDTGNFSNSEQGDQTRSGTLWNTGFTLDIDYAYVGTDVVNNSSTNRVYQSNSGVLDEVRIGAPGQSVINGWNDNTTEHDDIISYVHERTGDLSNTVDFTLAFDANVSDNQILIFGLDRGSESLTLKFYDDLGAQITDVSALSVTYVEDYSNRVNPALPNIENDFHDGTTGIYNGTPTVASSSESSGTFTFNGLLDDGGDGIHSGYDVVDFSLFAIDVPQDLQYRDLEMTFETDGTGPTRDSFGFTIVQTIPEPSSALLLCLGSLGLIVRRKKA